MESHPQSKFLSYEIQDQPFEDAADLLLRWYILPVRLLYWGAKCSGGMAIAGKRRDLDSAYEILEKMGIRRDTADQNVKELSGGQKQRVAIARAVACQARIILADEPTGTLDEDTAGEIIELFQKLAHEEGICVIVVTHMRMLAEKADDVIRLENKSFFTS